MWWWLLLFASAVFAATTPKQQSEAYHVFADQRPCCAIPNAADVMSNAAFLVVGAFKFLGATNLSSWIFAAGVTTTAVGSAYYHWLPTTSRLVWDRLPMTLAFGAAFHEPLCLNPCVSAAVGVGTVLYWSATSDLRAYAVFQYGGLACVLASGTHRSALLLYGAAKACEALDRPLFAWSGHRVSGHTLKHLLAAGACALV